MGRSPIEAMIDKACGIAPGYVAPPRDLVTLHCPNCKKTKQVDRETHDLPGTATIKMLCPDCNDGGEFEQIDYFRADGTQILEG